MVAAGRGGASAALIAAAQGGDQDAIVSLLAIAQPDIRRFARRACLADDVDDAVQEALWAMYRRIGGLQTLSSFTSWLFVIVKRECTRLARRAVALVDPQAHRDDAALAERPEHELRMDLAMAIQSLPDHYRVVIMMRDVEELTVDEIAASLTLSRENVKARLHRARILLREYLSR